MTGKAIREALEPCPFCGGAASVRPDEVGSGGQHVGPYWAGCPMPWGCGVVFQGDDPEEATKAWNRRAHTAYDAIGSDPANVDYEWEAKTAWDCQADDANQWDSLGADEKEGLKAVVAFAIGRGRSFSRGDAIGSGVKAEHIEAFRTVLESVLKAETSGARSPAIDFEARRFIRDHGAAILASLSPDDASAADAEIGRDFLNAIEAARDEYPWLANWTPAERYGELIGDLLDIAFPGGSASSDIVRDVVRKAILFSDWAAGEGICSSNPHIADPADFMSRLYVRGDETPDAIADAAVSCLSPHTAAGAGPVGETVVWQFEELHVGFGGQKSWHWRYSETHPGQRPDIRNVQPLYARPVEEPSEVERLTRERDEWKASSAMFEAAAAEGARGIEALEEIDAAWDAFGTRGNRSVLTLAEQVSSLNREVETAEAALAETRKALRYIAEGNLGSEPWQANYERIKDAARAALTGDAQEAGR